MRLPRESAELVPSVAAVGRGAPFQDIVEMLRSPWRTRQVAAWFSVVRDEPEILPAVLGSLRTSFGSLTAPALAAAAVLLGGERAIPALLDYQAAETERNFAVSGAVSAALEYVGATSPRGAASDSARSEFRRHLDVANEIRNADTTVKAAARAVITRLPAPKDRPSFTLAAQTMSFLLLPNGGEHGVGCIITPVPDSPVVPSEDGIPVALDFWSTEALDQLPPGTAVTLKYGRYLGTGYITS